MKKHTAGFTLIELMIVVVIIGVLASIAIPAYTQYVIQGKRAQARGTMLNIAQMQERAYTNSAGSSAAATYVAVAAAPAVATAPWENFSGGSMGTRKYDISVAAGTIADTALPLTTSFRIIATPSNNFIDTACGTLTLDSTGAKASSAGTAATCWSN